ncbi:nucleotide sugar dehydrogenase [Candidatus Villigracilis vicinus]|uniref:nucleotide sugar dehydrogenase n=1 Tax=Candidatus Villigracilis vicinus TaxID=3140679 RepID=UPI003136D6D0|nr:nucleotide sugar dehydrogenase [Anaerolineales bacterium]
MKYNKLCVIGLGYIGLPTASTFAMNGVDTLGVDISPAIIDTLNRGEIHIHEPGLGEAFESARQSGKFKAALKPEPADAFIIAVPTPFKHDETGTYQNTTYKLADMGAVIAAAESIVPYLRKGNIVVLESTSPPRTTIDLVAPILERSSLKAGIDFHLCYSPERVLPGQILRELIENSRVIGGVTPESAQAGAALYSIFVKGEIIQTDATTAEMVKLMENTYRDVNIAIANEFSRLADKFGVDVWEAIPIANLHPRVKILNPGPGVGGHCISVDPWFFVEAAPELTPLIYHSRQVNDSQPHFVVETVKRTLGSLKGKKIAALGLAYKPDVDDLRESPAVEVVHLLQNEGAHVTACEPFKPDAQLPGITIAPTFEDSIKEADALLFLVKHSEFTQLSPESVSKKTKARIIIDTVQGWTAAQWQNAGFRFIKLGSGKTPNH